MPIGNPKFKKGKQNPYYVNKKSNSIKDKIKFIKDNLHLKKELLSKKLNITVSSLRAFCANNGISLNSKKNLLKFISKNKNLSAGMIVKKTHLSKENIKKILDSDGIHDDRFSRVRVKEPKKTNNKDKKKTKKREILNESVSYEKISHQELNKVLIESSDVTRKFLDDLNGLELGGALKIKIEDWKMKANPFFYCQVKIKKFITFKLKVREIDGYYYIIKIS